MRRLSYRFPLDGPWRTFHTSSHRWVPIVLYAGDFP
jgi:hypothetical protein